MVLAGTTPDLAYRVELFTYDPAHPERFREEFAASMQPTRAEWDEMEDKRLIEMVIDPDMDPIDLMLLVDEPERPGDDGI